MTPSAHNASATKEAHLQAFERLAPGLPGAGTEWVEELRRSALTRFASTGLPNRKLEAWKFTGLNVLEQDAFGPHEPAPTATLRRAVFPPPAGCTARLVFVDGRLVPELCEAGAGAAGLTITSLATALNQDPGLAEGRISSGKDQAGALSDLNAAFMADGAVIRLDDGVTLDALIALDFIETGKAPGTSHLRNLILLGAGAKATIAETFIDAGDGGATAFTNAVTDIALSEGASLTHARIQDQNLSAVHTSRAVANISGGASYNSFAIATGSRISRQETEVNFAGPGGATRLYGAYLGHGRQHLDHTTRVDHAYPDCKTEESFRGVLDGRAHGVFQGLIRVAPHAVKTDARQKNQVLLLSDHAVADSKPELEILADDVKCAHGATVGDIDRDALFYLMSRGIPQSAAHDLLVTGFIGDLVNGFGDGGLAPLLQQTVARWQKRSERDRHD